MADDGRPVVQNLPIGIDARGTRTESDSMGSIEVPADRYWGAQTERSLHHFSIGRDRMPTEVYHAYGYVKKAAANVNFQLGKMPQWKSELISRVCDEVIDGALDDHFPLYGWQTGSGTQTNMNVNEVIANRCNQMLGSDLGSNSPVHPNDDVNMSQSSNDTFPTAMHIAAYKMAVERTIPSLERLRDALNAKAEQWSDVVKIGRTHLEDATPITVGQEWSGFVGALDDAIQHLASVTKGLHEIALGGTAVGTGINAPVGFDEAAAAELRSLTGYDFKPARNKFAALATNDRMVRAHEGLKGAAVTLFKIANDLRWLGSGPRTGLMELLLPENEPGSSIMPGKVNPTQAEAMMMVCMQVIGADVTVAMAGSQGNLQLNTCRPVVISNYLDSALIMADMCDHFRQFMIEGTELNEKTLRHNIDHSVMMVTALSPVIGYDQAAVIAHYAIANDTSLREAALANGVSAQTYDEIVIPLNMTHPA